PDRGDHRIPHRARRHHALPQRDARTPTDRRRDGARHWTLLRDLGERELWIERYHVATWLDYVRHNQRRTHEDAQNTRDILALHQGPAPPTVHRMIDRQTTRLPDMREVTPRELADPMTDPARQS